MKHLIFNKELDELSIQEILDWSYDIKQGEGTLFFTSCGGVSYASEILCPIFNEKRIKVVALFEVSSSAFEFFLKCDYIELGNSFSYGMYHKPTTKVDLSRLKHKDKNNSSHILFDSYDSICELGTAFFKGLNPTDEELSSYENNEDVLFSRDRMSVFIENSRSDEIR